MSSGKKTIQISKIKLCAHMTKNRTSKQGTYLFYTFLSNKIGCVSSNPGWIGVGYCDDENNNTGCHFDGGDCCGVNINTQYCNIFIQHEQN